MPFTVTFEVGETAQKIVEPNPSEIPTEVIEPTLTQVALKLDDTIQIPGYAPRDTGMFASRHQAIVEGIIAYIINPIQVEDGNMLWSLIVNGHAVLTTEKSRKWWFWHLKNELGGSYTRKTGGGPGYVSPDNYPERAIAAVISANYIQTAVEEEINKYFGID
jgi:hypothetical protein